MTERDRSLFERIAMKGGLPNTTRGLREKRSSQQEEEVVVVARQNYGRKDRKGSNM